MNQKVIIYIILSAILLYLYYRKKDFTIFVAFAVLAGATLIFRSATMSEEGFSGGDGGDKECAKLGFTAPKIVKKDIKGSLDKVLKNIEKVAEKYWGFTKGDIEGRRGAEDKTFEKSWNTIEKSFGNLVKSNKDAADTMTAVFTPAYVLYTNFIIIKEKTDAEKDKILEKEIMKKLDEIINKSKSAMDLINKLKNSDEMKDADKEVKNLLKYIICLAKQWVSIYKALQKAKNGDDDAGKDDEKEEEAGNEDDDKKKTKKKKPTKKKSKKDDEADEDE